MTHADVPGKSTSTPGILEETFAALSSAPSRNISARRIVRFCLSRYLTIVDLEHRSVGSCMSYTCDPDDHR